MHLHLHQGKEAGGGARRSKKVNGVYLLLSYHAKTLLSLEFIHCQLYPAVMDKVCTSLCQPGYQNYKIQSLSIKSSHIGESKSLATSAGLLNFLSHAKRSTSRGSSGGGRKSRSSIGGRRCVANMVDGGGGLELEAQLVPYCCCKGATEEEVVRVLRDCTVPGARLVLL